MDCARLDEPRDPEVGGWHAIRLRFGILGLGLEQLAEAALHELIFALTPERYFASSVDGRFRGEYRFETLPGFLACLCGR